MDASRLSCGRRQGLGGISSRSQLSLTSSGFRSTIATKLANKSGSLGEDTNTNFTCGQDGFAKLLAMPSRVQPEQPRLQWRNVPDLCAACAVRVAYLVTPTVLLYVTGGFAFGEANLNATWFSPALCRSLYQGAVELAPPTCV